MLDFVDLCLIQQSVYLIGVCACISLRISLWLRPYLSVLRDHLVPLNLKPVSGITWVLRQSILKLVCAFIGLFFSAYSTYSFSTTDNTLNSNTEHLLWGYRLFWLAAAENWPKLLSREASSVSERCPRRPIWFRARVRLLRGNLSLRSDCVDFV